MGKNKSDLLQTTADVLIAFLSQNKVAGHEIPNLIRSIFGAFTDLGAEKGPSQAERSQHPLLPISQLVKSDYLICAECGKKLRTMKFHLRLHGMTPASYRAKWALPVDFPMSAPNYSALRSTRAVQTEFGRRRTMQSKTSQPKNH